MSKKSNGNIWPNNVVIDVLGVTGAHAAGKTLFVCSIDPRHTKLYDFEKSAGAYVGLGIERVDVPAIMLEKYPKTYSPRQVFEWWYADIKQIQPGTYSVIAGDPISDIEEGLVDWVKSRYKEWGFKTEESFVSTGGIFWAKVKSEWKRVLADLSTRCQTFAFTTHLKLVWKHGKPTNQQTPKGKTTLMELASLFLFLERESGTLVPSATVLKSRLAATSVKDDEIMVIPALPPRLEVATPKRIREYIVSPPDYSDLRPDEVEREKVLSDADRLELEAQIAADKRAAEEAALQAAKTQAQIQGAREAAMRRLQPTVHDAPTTEEAPATEESGGAQEAPADEGTESVYAMVVKAGKLTEFARMLYTKLKSRPEPIDMTSFKMPEDAEDYIGYLSADEIERLKVWVAA